MSQPTQQLQHLSELPTLFRSAADHIELHGLAKGWYWTPAPAEDTPIGDCPTCTIGACTWAQTGRPIPVEGDEIVADAAQFLAQALGVSSTDPDTGEPDYVETVAIWNDAPDRTQAEVVAFLRRMAVEAAEADLLCRYIREHDDHQAGEWGATEFQSYLKERDQLRLAVAA